MLGCACVAQESQVALSPPVPITPAFFGMHINRRGEPWPLPTIPFGAYRTIDSWGTLWSVVERSPGVYNWTWLDPRLADAELKGVDVLYTIYSIPAFYSSNPRDASCSNAVGACYPPDDLNPDGSGTDQHLKNFMTALVNHVGNKIAYYEMWNEANIPSEWKGTWAQLVRMSQDMRSTILAVNPNAKLLSPSFVELTYNTAAIKAALYLQTSVNGSTGSDAADIINFHGYVVTPSIPVALAENEVVNVNNLRAALSDVDLVKPLWDTEWGNSGAISDVDLVVAFTARHLLIQATQGIARTYYFDWDPSNTRALWSNVIANCLGVGSPNAGGHLCANGTTYAQVESWLLGATSTVPCSGPLPPATGVWTCAFTRPDIAQMFAVWDTSQTCSNRNCTTSTYSYDSRYTEFLSLENENSNALSGGTVSIGVKPIILLCRTRQVGAPTGLKGVVNHH